MLLVKISIDIFGEKLNPAAVLSTLEDEVYVDEEFNSTPNSLSVENPSRIGLEYELDAYLEWYVDFIEKYHDHLMGLNAEEVNIMTTVFYSEQCNFELFDRSQMQRLGKYHLAFPISVYRTEESELKDILKLRRKERKIT